MMGLDARELTLFVELSAKALELPIPPEFLPGVLANAQILSDHAQRVLAFALPPETPNTWDIRP